MVLKATRIAKLEYCRQCLRTPTDQSSQFWDDYFPRENSWLLSTPYKLAPQSIGTIPNGDTDE